MQPTIEFKLNAKTADNLGNQLLQLTEDFESVTVKFSEPDEADGFWESCTIQVTMPEITI